MQFNGNRLIPERAVWQICHDISRGLFHIHSHGMVHYDIKPSIIFRLWSGGGYWYKRRWSRGVTPPTCPVRYCFHRAKNTPARTCLALGWHCMNLPRRHCGHFLERAIGGTKYEAERTYQICHQSGKSIASDPGDDLPELQRTAIGREYFGTYGGKASECHE